MTYLSSILLLYLFVPILRGVIVYRDAKSRGMDPGLWTVAAAFVPFFVGFIIYFIVSRSSKSTLCSHCGQAFNANFNNCPYCGTPAALSSVAPPKKMSTTDTLLWAALIFCMLSPFVLLFILALAANM